MKIRTPRRDPRRPTPRLTIACHEGHCVTALHTSATRDGRTHRGGRVRSSADSRQTGAVGMRT
jgi:hypothetical protein